MITEMAFLFSFLKLFFKSESWGQPDGSEGKKCLQGKHGET